MHDTHMEIPAPLIEWQQGGMWFKYRGHSVFCRIQGQGSPLLLLHGFPTASWDYHLVWPQLLERHQVICLDFLGFGFSDKPIDYSYRLMDQCDLVCALMAELQVRNCHIVSHNIANSIVQELLVRQLNGVLDFGISRVSFLNGVLFPELYKPLFIQSLMSSPIGSIASRFVKKKHFQNTLSRLFGDRYHPGMQEFEMLWELVEYNNGRAILHRVSGYLKERHLHRHRWVDALCKTRVPLQLIAGEEDIVCDQQTGQRFRQLVPQGVLCSLPDVGHFPQLECPRKVVELIEEFSRQAIPVRAL